MFEHGWGRSIYQDPCLGRAWSTRNRLVIGLRTPSDPSKVAMHRRVINVAGYRIMRRDPCGMLNPATQYNVSIHSARFLLKCDDGYWHQWLPMDQAR